jgi:hypothetical protein
MAKINLREKAEGVMRMHGVTSCYATPDGNIFLPKSKNAADFHARNTKQTVMTFSIEAEEDEPEDFENESKTEDTDDKLGDSEIDPTDETELKEDLKPNKKK